VAQRVAGGACQLGLWFASRPYIKSTSIDPTNRNTSVNCRKQNPSSNAELDPLDKLSVHYKPPGPPDRMVHILVQPPESESIYPRACGDIAEIGERRSQAEGLNGSPGPLSQTQEGLRRRVRSFIL
jgi:hypothetical protein